MFTIDNRKISTFYERLLELEEFDLKRSDSLRVALITEEAEKLARHFNKQHNEIVEKHTKKDENGEAIPVRDEDGNIVENRINVEDPEAFQEELEELLEGENEIYKKKIPLKRLPKTIKPGVIRGCLPMIEYDEDELDDFFEEEEDEDTEVDEEG